MDKKECLNYACKAADMIMKKYEAKNLPPKNKFHYHQGVFLSGVMDLYALTGEKKYYEYTEKYVDSCVNEEGVISRFDACMLDDIQPAILFFKLCKSELKEKYSRALTTCMTILKNWKRNEVNGFWHKEYHPHEMWLDGLYMAGPLQAEYGVRYNVPEFIDTAYEQALLMHKYMSTPDGLLYHAWDCKKEQPWCDKKTGLSPEVWSRALGWYLVASLDIIELDSKDSEQKKKLTNIIKDMLNAVIRYQDEGGMWYQIANKPTENRNWRESSGTALFVYSIAKAVRLGILTEEYMNYANKGFEGCIKEAVKEIDGEFCLDLICPGTGAGMYDMYVERPKSKNDLHGMGAFLLMCTELCKKENN